MKTPSASSHFVIHKLSTKLTHRRILSEMPLCIPQDLDTSNQVLPKSKRLCGDDVRVRLEDMAANIQEPTPDLDFDLSSPESTIDLNTPVAEHNDKREPGDTESAALDLAPRPSWVNTNPALK